MLLSQTQHQLQEQNLHLQQEVAEHHRAEHALQAETAMNWKYGLRNGQAELRLANAELAKALRLKDEFLAAMSHELHTPLHVILGMSGALLEGVYGTLQEKCARVCTLIEDSGQRLLAVIDHVLKLPN